MGEELLCPECLKRVVAVADSLSVPLEDVVSLDGGNYFPLDWVEELRLHLKSLMRPEVLQTLLELHKVLEREPQQTKMFSWFVRNSEMGEQCRYSTMALERFKRERLERVRELLGECLERLSSGDL
jgi:hypothetical protein